MSQRRDSTAVRTLADIYRLAQERVSLTAGFYALQQWNNVNPLKPVAGAWLARVIARIVRQRRLSLLLAWRYYNLSRAIAAGRALPNPDGPKYPDLVPLTRLLDDFGDVIDDITRGTVGTSRERRSARRVRRDPGQPSRLTPREETVLLRVDLLEDSLDKALDAFEKKYADLLDVSVEVDESPAWLPVKDLDESKLTKAVKDELGKLVKQVKILERDKDLEAAEFKAKVQDRNRASAYRVAGTVARSAVGSGDQAMNDLINADELVIGWLRVTGSSPCSLCAMLASRGVRWKYKTMESALLTPRLGNKNENRRARLAAEKGADIKFVKTHNNCFPAGTLVSGPATEQATRRVFEGEVIVIRTAAGNELTCTPNHPILTPTGWIPAGLLEEGDHVVRSIRTNGANALHRPDENQAPALIEDVWSSGLMGGLTSVPVAAEDFHGDGCEGEVEVVGTTGDLTGEIESALAEECAHHLLLLGGEGHPLGAGASGDASLFERALSAAHGLVCRGGHDLPLFGTRVPVAGELSLGAVADVESVFGEPADDDGAANSVFPSESLDALARLVSGDDLADGEIDTVGPRFDAPFGELSAETCAGYAGRGMDLLDGLSGQVELDRVVEQGRVEFSGHVYNISTSEGWYASNGLIVSNCQCTAMPIFNDTPIRSERDKFFEDSWGSATRGHSGKDALRVWRSWLAKQYKDGRVPSDEISI